jgi:hypothetical protein
MGFVVGGLGPLNLNGNDATYLVNEIFGATLGFGVGLVLDVTAHGRR